MAFTEVSAVPKDTASAGGATTASVADAGRPVAPWFEVMALVTLFLLPAVVPVTLTNKLQEAPAANVAPDRLTLPPPATAVMLPPPHAPVRPLGVASSNPGGRVSVNPIPVKAEVVFGLPMANASVVAPPWSGTLGAPNNS